MAPSVFYEQGAFLLAVKPNADGGLRTNLKGRMNFSTLGTGPGTHRHALRFQFPEDHRHREQPSNQ